MASYSRDQDASLLHPTISLSLLLLCFALITSSQVYYFDIGSLSNSLSISGLCSIRYNMPRLVKRQKGGKFIDVYVHYKPNVDMQERKLPQSLALRKNPRLAKKSQTMSPGRTLIAISSKPRWKATSLPAAAYSRTRRLPAQA